MGRMLDAERTEGTCACCRRRTSCGPCTALRCAAPGDQALALLLLLRAGPPESRELVQKLAAWVGQGAAPPPGPFASLAVSSSPWESALRARALAAYDGASNSTVPDLAVKALAVPAPASGTGAAKPVELLSAQFNASNAGRVARGGAAWDSLPPGSRLVFSARGAGEASVAASLNFTPAALLPFPTYRGLWVARVVQRGGGEAGGSVGAAPLGELVTLAVQVRGGAAAAGL